MRTYFIQNLFSLFIFYETLVMKIYYIAFVITVVVTYWQSK